MSYCYRLSLFSFSLTHFSVFVSLPPLPLSLLVVTPGKKSSKKFKEEEKSDSDTPQSTKPHLNDDSMRQHAKKAFKQVLLTRYHYM